MKIRTILLQAGAIAAPLVALIIGLIVLVNGQGGEGIATAAAETVLDDIVALNLATRSYLSQPGDTARNKWREKYTILRESIKILESRWDGDRSVVDPMSKHCDELADAFSKIAAGIQAGGENAETGDSDDKLVGELFLRANAIAGGAFQVASLSHTEAVTSSQRANFIVIIVMSVLAVVMAGGTFTAVRKQRVELRKTTAALRKSNIRLSDVSVRLTRARSRAATREHLHEIEEAARQVARGGRSAFMQIEASTRSLVKTPGETVTREPLAVHEAVVKKAQKKLEDAVEHFDRLMLSNTGIGEVSLNNVVTEAIRTTKDVWERPEWKSIAVEIDLAKPLDKTIGNEAELMEAVANLIHNSVEAMPDGGRMKVRTVDADETVIIEISDTGVGMTEEVREKCLEPFFSAKGSDAAGTGLTLVDGTVRRHGGTVEVSSEAGKGTTIALSFPKKGMVGDAAATLADRPEGPTELKILAVDDEKWARAAISQMLLVDRHVVTTAENGADAIAKFKAGEFEVVITDQAMPDMGGEELAAAIKRIDPKIPVILASGFAEGGRRKGLPKNIDAVVLKPASVDDIRLALVEAVGARGTGAKGDDS